MEGIIVRNPIETSELFSDLKFENTHLIMPASFGYTNVYNLFIDYYGMPKSQLEGYINQVKVQNEVGCFFPRYFVSLYPEIAYTNPNFSSFIKKNIQDSFKANEQYLKRSRMVFLVDNKHSEYFHAFQETIQSVKSTYPSNTFFQIIEVAPVK